MMILGLTTYTFVHVVIRLVGIGSGLVVVFGLIASKRLDGWTVIFLASTAATCLTGLFFPFHGLKPSYVVGALTMIVLALAILARYLRQFVGAWRWIYVLSAVIALYFNVFVLNVQAFLKVPALKTLAATQSEPPFQITQLVALAFFIVLAVVAVKKFRIEPVRTS